MTVGRLHVAHRAAEAAHPGLVDPFLMAVGWGLPYRRGREMEGGEGSGGESHGGAVQCSALWRGLAGRCGEGMGHSEGCQGSF